jgi:hypothetical protein
MSPISYRARRHFALAAIVLLLPNLFLLTSCKTSRYLNPSFDTNYPQPPTLAFGPAIGPHEVFLDSLHAVIFFEGLPATNYVTVPGDVREGLAGHEGTLATYLALRNHDYTDSERQELGYLLSPLTIIDIDELRAALGGVDMLLIPRHEVGEAPGSTTAAMKYHVIDLSDGRLVYENKHSTQINGKGRHWEREALREVAATAWLELLEDLNLIPYYF